MKKLFTIIITIAALIGAIVLGYSALKKKEQASPQPAPPASTILPYGTNLDFQDIEEFNKASRLFPYPKVTPPEIGTAPSSLVP